MTQHDMKFTQIVDAPALARAVSAIAAEHGGATPAARAALLAEMRRVSSEGREKARSLLENDGSGLLCAARISHLQDTIITALFDYATTHAYPTPSSGAGAGDGMTVAAVGGYGRGTLAPGSDIDLLFILADRRSGREEDVAQFVLYVLWDMASRSATPRARSTNAFACRAATSPSAPRSSKRAASVGQLRCSMH